MTWRSSLPLQFSTTVAAFVVDEAALPSMLTWQPPTTTDVGKTLLDYQQVGSLGNGASPCCWARRVSLGTAEGCTPGLLANGLSKLALPTPRPLCSCCSLRNEWWCSHQWCQATAVQAAALAGAALCRCVWHTGWRLCMHGAPHATLLPLAGCPVTGRATGTGRPPRLVPCWAPAYLPAPLMALAPGQPLLQGSQDCLLPPGAQEHSAEAVFTFNKLSFGAPSQMRPRWLVFAASLLGGGCVYSHYLVGGVQVAVHVQREQAQHAQQQQAQLQPPAASCRVRALLGRWHAACRPWCAAPANSLLGAIGAALLSAALNACPSPAAPARCPRW